MKSPKNKSDFIYVATDEHIIPNGTLSLGELPMIDYLILWNVRQYVPKKYDF